MMALNFSDAQKAFILKQGARRGALSKAMRLLQLEDEDVGLLSTEMLQEVVRRKI